MFPNPRIAPAWLHSVLARNDSDAEHLAAFLDREEVPDNLYGQLRLNEVEVQVINTPEFQRLRYISQLAFAKAAFHTAEHSRFSHSLGACHVAKILADRLNANLASDIIDRTQEDASYWLTMARRGNPTRSFAEVDEMYRCGEIVTWTERVLIGLAGLLHDLPHCPYSHDIEGGLPAVIPKHDDYRRNPAFAIMLFDRERSTLAQVLAFYSEHFYRLMLCDPQWRDCERLRVYGDPHRRKRMLADSIFELFVYETPADVQAGVIPVHTLEWPRRPLEEPPPTVKWWVSTNDAWLDGGNDATSPLPSGDWFQPYRHDLIGNTICADLVDYLARDATNAGVPVALDFKFLSRLSVNRYNPDKAAEKYLHIVFDLRDAKRGTIRYDVLHELFDYLRDRFRIRERVTSHRVTHEGAAILKRAVTLLSVKPDGTPWEKPFLTLKQLHTDYRCNSDDAVLRYVATSADLLDTRLDGSSETPAQRADAMPVDPKGPPLEARKRAAALALRLLERRYHRPLVFLTSQQSYDRIRQFALSFEPPKTGSSDFVVQNVWAIENQVLESLGAAAGEIADKVIVYVLKPRGGLKEANMLVAIRGEFRDLEVLPLKDATGEATGTDEAEAAPHLQGVQEATKLFEADYLTLWRVFLLVAPELLEKGRRPERAAEDFHRWIRGWRFVRQSHTKIDLPAREVAKMLSHPEQWQENAQRLAEKPVGTDARWTSDTSNGVNVRQLTFDADARHRCRDIRHAFPLEEPGVVARQVERSAADSEFIAINSPLLQDGDYDDASDHEVLTPSMLKVEQQVKRLSASLSTAQASFDANRFDECRAHLESIFAAHVEEGDAVQRIRNTATLLSGKVMLRIGRPAESLRILTSVDALDVATEVEMAGDAIDMLRLMEAAAVRTLDGAIEDLSRALELERGRKGLAHVSAQLLERRAAQRLRKHEYDEAALDFEGASQRFEAVHDEERAAKARSQWWDCNWKSLTLSNKLGAQRDVDEYMARRDPVVQRVALEVRKRALSTVGVGGRALGLRKGRHDLKVWKRWCAEARAELGSSVPDEEE